MPPSDASVAPRAGIQQVPIRAASLLRHGGHWAAFPGGNVPPKAPRASGARPATDLLSREHGAAGGEATGDGDAAGSDLRGGVLRLLRRVSARTLAASSAGSLLAASHRSRSAVGAGGGQPPALPGRLLADQDFAHPSPIGSYLDACVFFATLSGQSPVGLPAKMKVEGSTWDSTAVLGAERLGQLRRIAQYCSQESRRE